MKKLLLILPLLLRICYAQLPAIDSLKQELMVVKRQPKGFATDTLQCNILTAVMKAYVDVDIDSASHYNQQLMALSEKPGLEKHLLYAYQYAGYLYQVRGDYHQSIRFHYKALPVAEKLGEYTRMAASYGWLAHAYTSLKEFDKAAKFCEQGLSLLRKHPDSYVQASILNVQGAIYRQQGKLKQALKVNMELYELARKDGHMWYEAQGLHAIGWVYKEMNDMPQALEYFGNALALARKTRSVDLEGSILLNISNLYFRQSKWKESLAYCNIALETARRVGNSSIEAEAFETLYKIFKQIKRPAEALRSYESFVQLKDSLSKEKTDHRIESLKAQYDNVQKTSELQKKQVELLDNQRTRNGLFIGIVSVLVIASVLFWNNSRLQAKNELINGQKALLEIAREELADVNKTLETRVEERTEELLVANLELLRKNNEIKEALFKGQTIERKRVAIELHDNLSSLLSAVNMTMQHIDPKNLSESEQSVYENVRYLVRNAYAEVRNISHNILPPELEKDGLVMTLASLVGKLNQNSPLQFSLMISDLDDRLPVEIEFNVYSIVFELINNVIKHAQASVVTISLRRTDSGVDIAVTDDGIGMAKSQEKRGVGLQNIQTRLESLGGTFTNSAPIGKGTRVAIEIPIETISFNGNPLNS
ncbi:Signal transduction histidine kinase [Dyadobacter soli]|uniref:Oxygen sensor histidine kinase NreB n=1 Tax=Dyadobacter soli TaxID=659014 RepID=A0A1G7WSQ2_9BACT|nr:tetratricopeptide repeat protein [Dyadobacter soli]SDG74936.1 Signal transduction histidine kinase [Dyadobacter soli]